MTPTAIINEAMADGVSLTISPTGTIKATGNGAAVNQWLPKIREHKAGIVAALKVGTGDTVATSTNADEEAAISAWLAMIEETDPATISEVMSQCRRDTGARDYFTGRAAAELNQKGGE